MCGNFWELLALLTAGSPARSGIEPSGQGGAVPSAGVSGRAERPRLQSPGGSGAMRPALFSQVSFSLGEEPLFSPTLQGAPCGTPAKLFLDLESESVHHAAVSQYL